MSSLPFPHTNPHHERRWLILGFLGLAQLMVVLDATVVNIALPSAQKALGFSLSDRQWIITAYALAFGSLLLLGGRIADLFGRKRIFIIGAIGFALASAMGGFAQSFAVLVGARAIQGAFAALLAPAALSLLTTTFTEPSERGKAFGIYGAIAGAGGAIGLLMGGVLTEYLSWRWCLYINILFAIPATVGAFVLLHNQRAEKRPKLDIPGALTASGGLFSLVFGLSRAQTNGWGAEITVICFAVAAILLTLFIGLQRRVQNPLLPLRVILDRNRGGAYLAQALAAAGMFGVFLFLTYYLQLTLHYSPIKTGLAFVPMVTLLVISSTIASTKALPRFGPRPLIVVGMMLGFSGMLYMTGLGVHSTYVSSILPALLILGTGMGLIFTTAINTATKNVGAHDAGVASAMVNTSQQVGGSTGTALLNTIFASAVTASLVAAHYVHGSYVQATVHGYTTSFYWGAGIFALGALVCGFLLRGGEHAYEDLPITDSHVYASV